MFIKTKTQYTTSDTTKNMEGLLGKDFVYAGLGASHHEKAGRKRGKTASKRA